MAACEMKRLQGCRGSLDRAERSESLRSTETGRFLALEDIKVFERITASVRNKNVGEIEKKEITHITFNFLSENEIKNWSVCDITSQKLMGYNSLFDPRMGPTHANEECETCKQTSKTCPGHCGSIRLPRKVPHPLRCKLITQFLSLFCHNCYHLVITEDKIKLSNIHKKKGEHKFKALLDERENNCSTCPNCNILLPSFSHDDECRIYMKYKNKNTIIPVEKIDLIFSHIPPIDVQLIGLDHKKVHPSNFLISQLIVLPPCARPPVRNDTGQNHDDLTYKYQEILKNIENFNKTSESNTFQRNNFYDYICFHIKTYMDNSKGKAKNQGNKRVIKCIKKRMTSKTGLIRGNLQGKRVNFCARSVISPEANGWVDELVVPESFAKTITFPVTVNQLNIDQCQALIDEDKASTVIRDGKQIMIQFRCYSKGFDLRENDIIKRPKADGSGTYDVFVHGNKNITLLPGDSVQRYNKLYTNVEPKKKKERFMVKEGDVVERFLQNDDWTLFNRQPTLWKYSMRAFRVKIRPGRTFRFNLACTQSFNADFDGDEMNAFFAQSELTKAEAKHLLSVSKNFMSAQDSRPVLSIKQDAMTGGYKLTYGYVPIRKDVFMDAFSHEKYPMDMYNNKRKHVIAVYKKYNLYDSFITYTNTYHHLTAKLALLNRIDPDELSTEDKKAKQSLEALLEEELVDIHYATEEKILYNGKTFFSFLLPNDFNYYLNNGICPEGKPVEIREGVMLSGTLNKAAMGSASGSLTHHMWKDYGEDKACWFVSMYQIMINFWFQHEGFSVGLEDCIPENKQVIDDEMQKAFLRAQAILNIENDKDVKEMQIMFELNKATSIGQRHAKAALKPTNNLVSMIRSGSKGDWLNIAQVTGAIGQQYVSAQRIQKNFGGRTLPYFPKSGVRSTDSDVLPEHATIEHVTALFKSRGFVTGSFYHGISPTEFFFHAGGGREGLIDTSLKTGETGYNQRRLIKMMEDFKASYANTIVNSTNNVIQFDYGGDNMDCSHLINISNNSASPQFSFVHVNHLVDRLNVQYEQGC
jgi:DNA-directed RNA polymerase II subunit RPB1